MAKLTRQEVEYVARLARLALTEEEKEKFRGQLENILGYFEKLNELDTSDVPATAHPFFTRNTGREDRTAPFADREAILANAPAREEDFFKVNKVIE